MACVRFFTTVLLRATIFSLANHETTILAEAQESFHVHVRDRRPEGSRDVSALRSSTAGPATVNTANRPSPDTSARCWRKRRFDAMSIMLRPTIVPAASRSPVQRRLIADCHTAARVLCGRRAISPTESAVARCKRRADEVRGVARAELAHRLGAMAFEGSRTDTHLEGALLVRMTLADQFQHLALAMGQPVARIRRRLSTSWAP